MKDSTMHNGGVGQWFALFLSIVALVVSAAGIGLTLYMQATVTVVEAKANYYLRTCPEMQRHILDLAEAGLSQREIVAVLNEDELPILEGKTNAWDPDGKDGPGYDSYYKPLCGDISLVLGEAAQPEEK